MAYDLQRVNVTDSTHLILNEQFMKEQYPKTKNTKIIGVGFRLDLHFLNTKDHSCKIVIINMKDQLEKGRLYSAFET